MITTDEDQPGDLLGKDEAEVPLSAAPPPAEPAATLGSDTEESLSQPSQSQQKTPDNTAEMPKNQAKGTALEGLTLRQRIDQRLAVIDHQLAEKERLQLSYVYQKVPKPYYWRWKGEGNAVFSLAVGLRARRRKLG